LNENDSSALPHAGGWTLDYGVVREKTGSAMGKDARFPSEAQLALDEEVRLMQ
jgi:hypothetical protein